MTAPAAAPTTPFELLRTPGYRRLLLLAALVGIPVSLVAFGFVALKHFLENQIWESLSHALGHATPPWWWPLPALGLCGVLAGLSLGAVLGPSCAAGELLRGRFTT
jgi:hypothetical protein